MSDWIIIGISGVTCGGKTTLSNKLKQLIVPVYVFHQDKYFFPDDSPHHVKCENIDHNNYDILSSLDMNSMYNDILSTLQGEDRSFEKCEEWDASKVSGKKFLIIEGFTALNYKPIMDICNLRYYFILEYGVCFERRSHRLYDPPDVDGYFEQCVWPEHVKYRDEIEKDSRVSFLDGTKPNVYEVVMSDIRRLCTAEPSDNV